MIIIKIDYLSYLFIYLFVYLFIFIFTFFFKISIDLFSLFQLWFFWTILYFILNDLSHLPFSHNISILYFLWQPTSIFYLLYLLFIIYRLLTLLSIYSSSTLLYTFSIVLSINTIYSYFYFFIFSSLPSFFFSSLHFSSLTCPHLSTNTSGSSWHSGRAAASDNDTFDIRVLSFNSSIAALLRPLFRSVWDDVRDGNLGLLHKSTVL